MFGTPATLQNKGFGFNNTFGNLASRAATTTPVAVKDFEVVAPPDDTIAALAFSPKSVNQNFLVSGSWDNQLRCWEIQQNGQSVPQAQQTHQGPVLDVAWSDDGTKVFSGSADRTVKMWDLNSNQSLQIGQHAGPVRTVHWIKAGHYQCVMTGSWDKTLKFWDTRSSNPMMSLNTQERVYCADVAFPMAIVATAHRSINVYSLENTPREFRQIESALKYQYRCLAAFTDKKSQQVGFAVGSVEGRVGINYVNQAQHKDNFTFKCHRSSPATAGGLQDVYPVNDVAFHPVHGTLVTIGSDGKYSMWDKDARTKLKHSEQAESPLTRCCFNATGDIFAYAVGYDWSKGHEYANPQRKNHIFLRPCFEDMKPRSMKK